MSKKGKTYKAPAKGWNHRVVRREYPGKFPEVLYGIHETFYGLDGRSKKPAFTTEPSDVVGESIEGLRQTLKWMLASLDKPVLDYKTRKEING